MGQRKHNAWEGLDFEALTSGDNPGSCLSSQASTLQPQFALPNSSPASCLVCPAPGWGSGQFPLSLLIHIPPVLQSQPVPSSPVPPTFFSLGLLFFCKPLSASVTWAMGQSAFCSPAGFSIPEDSILGPESCIGPGTIGTNSQHALCLSMGRVGVDAMNESQLVLVVCLGKMQLSSSFYGSSKVMSVCL